MDANLIRLGACIALLPLAVGSAVAGVVHVSLGDTAGPGVNGPAGGAGATWNSWSPIREPLKDAGGNLTTVQVRSESERVYGDWWCDLRLLSGGLATGDGVAVPVRITGLKPDGAYDLYVACARGRRSANTLCTLTGPGSSGLSQQADNRWAANGSSWVRGENHVLFQDLVPDATGGIEFAFEGRETHGIVNGLQIIEVSEPVKTYAQWAAEPVQGFEAGVNDGPLDDPDEDGVVNLLEFVMNGEPFVRSPQIRPGLARAGDQWVFEYDRRDCSRAPSCSQVVEYSIDLRNWTPVQVSAVGGGVVEIVDHGLSDRVRVTLPGWEDELFVRLRVEVPALPTSDQADQDP